MLFIEHVRERSTARRDSKTYQIQTRFQVNLKKFREILEIGVSRPVSFVMQSRVRKGKDGNSDHFPSNNFFLAVLG